MHGQGRIGVVHADDEPERDHLLAHRVDEAAAELAMRRAAPKRPAESMDDPVERLRNLPDLLHAERVDLRRLALDPELGDRGSRQVSQRSLSNDRRARADVRSGLERAELLAVTCATAVARPHADDTTAGDEQLRGSGLRDDRHAQLFGSLGEPARQAAHRSDVVAVVQHGRRRRHVDGPFVRQVVDGLVVDRPVERHVVSTQPGKQEPQRAGVDHRAREDVRPAGLALLDDRDRHVPQPLGELGALLQELTRPDRSSETRRAAADDEDADLDPLVGAVARGGDELALGNRRREICGADGHVSRSASVRARSAWERRRTGHRPRRGRSSRRSARCDPC